MSLKVIVVIENGMVQGVYSDEVALQCIVIDKDVNQGATAQQGLDEYSKDLLAEIDKDFYFDVLNNDPAQHARVPAEFFKIHSGWCVEDILGQAESDEIELTAEEAKEILISMDNTHDATVGINWEVISSCIAMFDQDREEAA